MAAILGAVVAGESFTAIQLAGSALALSSLVAGQLTAPNKKVYHRS